MPLARKRFQAIAWCLHRPDFDAYSVYFQNRPLFGDFHRFIQVIYLQQDIIENARTCLTPVLILGRGGTMPKKNGTHVQKITDDAMGPSLPEFYRGPNPFLHSMILFVVCMLVHLLVTYRVCMLVCIYILLGGMS
jgi:hypothetical protein